MAQPQPEIYQLTTRLRSLKPFVGPCAPPGENESPGAPPLRPPSPDDTDAADQESSHATISNHLHALHRNLNQLDPDIQNLRQQLNALEDRRHVIRQQIDFLDQAVRQLDNAYDDDQQDVDYGFVPSEGMQRLKEYLDHMRLYYPEFDQLFREAENSTNIPEELLDEIERRYPGVGNGLKIGIYDILEELLQEEIRGLHFSPEDIDDMRQKMYDVCLRGCE
ncbi:hypothetical protein FPQ18DRAFT_399082 [Pyronema domesticum]|nr:hypothetical protein FPQ18DRAFT_399082 [Pyronema domesticum]